MQKKLTQQGLRFLEEGQFEKARQILSLLITRFPQNAEAHHMLGIIELEKGNHDAAYVLVNTAIELTNDNPVFYNTLGNIELHRKKIAQAEKAFIKAVKFNSDKTEYKYNLAHFYLSQNQYAKAIDYYYYILHNNPTHYLSIRGITVCYLFSGEVDIALEHAQEWVHEYSEYDEPYYYLGLCLFARNDITAALAAYDKGLSLAPTNHEIIAAIGACYRSLGNASIAETYIHKTLSLEPHNPQAIYNLAGIHLDKGDTDTARNLFLNAANLDPKYADPVCGLGHIELIKGRDDLALGYFTKACGIDPENSMPKLLKATTFLRQENFALGWASYMNTLSPMPAIKKIAEWRGEAKENQVLLVWTPKEISDLSLQIMFYSMLPGLLRLVQNLVLVCDQKLVKILQSSYPNCKVISQITLDELEDNTYGITQQIPVGGLGKYLRLSRKDFLHNSQYLFTTDKQRDYYRSKYQQLFPGKKLIGIAWKSCSSTEGIDYIKSSHLRDWKNLLEKTDCQFISLQPGNIQAEINNRDSGFGLYFDPEVNANKNIQDFCAQITALDAVISVDNYVAHLAGALGAQVSTLLPLQAEWYWFKDRKQSIWYPSMSIVPQKTLNQWSEPLNSILP